MADTTINFEGVASGASVTTTNEPLLSSVSAGAGGVIKGEPAVALNGSMGVELTSGTSAVCMIEATFPVAATTHVLHVPLKLPTTFPTVASGGGTLLQIYGDNGAGGTQVIARIRLTLSGAAWQLTFSDLGDAHTVTLHADLSPLAGTYMAIALQLNAGTTTSNGSFSSRLYSNPYSTTLYGSEVTATNHNLGAGLNILKFRVGYNTTLTAVRTLGTDYIRFKNSVSGAGAWYGAVPAVAPPVANAGADQLMARNGTVTVSASASTGAIGSYTWSAVHSEGASVTIGSPSASSSTISTAAAGHVTVTLSLTPAGGGTAVTDTMEIFVRPLAGEDVTVYQVDTTPFSNVGGATSIKAALNDTNSSTWAQSPDTPTGQVLAVWYQPMGLGNIRLMPLNRAMGGAITTVTESLYVSKGGALIDSWTYTPVQTTFTEQTLDVDTSGLSIVPTEDSRKQLYHTIAVTA